jgi:hypothetical protein
MSKLSLEQFMKQYKKKKNSYYYMPTFDHPCNLFTTYIDMYPSIDSSKKYICTYTPDDVHEVDITYGDSWDAIAKTTVDHLFCSHSTDEAEQHYTNKCAFYKHLVQKDADICFECIKKIVVDEIDYECQKYIKYCKETKTKCECYNNSEGKNNDHDLNIRLDFKTMNEISNSQLSQDTKKSILDLLAITPTLFQECQYAHDENIELKETLEKLKTEQLNIIDAQNDESKDIDKCCICMKTLGNMRCCLFPCGHSRFHKVCISSVDKCPLCRNKFMSVNNLYL